jgi:hypothetical protein
MTVGAYDEDIAMALELIEEAGQQCVWRKQTTTPADPDRPWLGGVDTPVDHTPFIAFVPATDAPSGFGLTKFRQGEDVPVFSTFGLMGAQAFEPEIADVLLRGGVPQVLAAVAEIRPAEEVVLYVLSIV